MERRDCVTCVELFLRLPWLSTHFANIHHLWHQPGGIIGESELFEFSLFVQVIHYFKCCFQRCVMVRRMEVKNLGCISILEHYGWNVSNLDTRGLESSQTGLHLTPDTLLTEILLVPWVDLVVYEPPRSRQQAISPNRVSDLPPLYIRAVSRWRKLGSKLRKASVISRGTLPVQGPRPNSIVPRTVPGLRRPIISDLEKIHLFNTPTSVCLVCCEQFQNVFHKLRYVVSKTCSCF